MRSEMCSLHLTHPSGGVGSRHCGARGAVGGSVPCSRVSPQSWTLPARAEIQTHNLGLPRVSSPSIRPWLPHQILPNALSIRPRLPHQTNHQILLTTLSSLGITGIPLHWFESQWQVFQCSLGRGVIHRTSTGHWGSSGIGSWTPPLLHIHYITGSYHTSTWFLIQLLWWWWHTALSFISTRWSNGSCTDLRLPGGYISMDERTSPTAQPGKDWASCLPCHSNSTAWFHHPARFFLQLPSTITIKKKSFTFFYIFIFIFLSFSC